MQNKKWIFSTRLSQTMDPLRYDGFLDSQSVHLKIRYNSYRALAICQLAALPHPPSTGPSSNDPATLRRVLRVISHKLPKSFCYRTLGLCTWLGGGFTPNFRPLSAHPKSFWIPIGPYRNSIRERVLGHGRIAG